MKQELVQQIDLLKRKMVVQNNTNQNNQEVYFRRTRNTLNTSVSSTITNPDKTQSKGEISAIRKQMEIMRDEMKKVEGLAHVTEKIIFLE